MLHMNTTHGAATASKRRARLTAIAAVCAVGLIPAIAIWLVNIKLGLEAVLPSATETAAAPLTGWTALLAPLSGDLSTISTLVPILLLLFPLIQALRILRRHLGDEAAIHELHALPYPDHFPFFLVMLGLTGTLYGLWMGLSVSGVSTMATGVPDPEELPAMLDRLLDGTATALLSSLIGLIGAFFAARPLPLLFEWAACLDPVEEERTLEDTIDHLTRDLKALGAATRAATDTIRPESLQHALDRVDALALAVHTQTEQLTGITTQVETIAHTTQACEASLTQLAPIQHASSQTAENTAQLTPLLQALTQSQTTIGTQLEQSLAAIQQERTHTQQLLTALHNTFESATTANQQERTQLHNACKAYLKGANHDA
jgi:DNA repair exonuclease SbcCD ATPase subunit